MPEETLTQNAPENQTATGNETPVINNEGTQGGPSDEFKMMRLEKEKAELSERLKRIEEQRQSELDATLTPEEKFTTEQEGFYRERTADTISKELATEIEKLPKALQDRIKADPFNTAWLDEKTLEFELYGIDATDPKAKYEAVKKAALKSIPEFVAGFGVESKPTQKEGSFGTNPPLNQVNAMTGGKDYAMMSDEELVSLRNAMKGSTI